MGLGESDCYDCFFLKKLWIWKAMNTLRIPRLIKAIPIHNIMVTASTSGLNINTMARRNTRIPHPVKKTMVGHGEWTPKNPRIQRIRSFGARITNPQFCNS